MLHFPQFRGSANSIGRGKVATNNIKRPELYFGDAIFERRQRVRAKSNLLQPANPPIYDSSGRIPMLPDRAKAEAEGEKMSANLDFFSAVDHFGYDSVEEESARVNGSIAKVKQANAELAQDRNNKAAALNLKQAIHNLKNLHYFNRPAISPHVVHGYANLGLHTYSNAVYEATRETCTPGELQELSNSFEGMFIDLTHKSDREVDVYRSAIESELPMLDEAIALTDRMEGTPQARQLAKIEYLIAKGEVYHGLAHLRDIQDDEFYERSDQARVAFQQSTNLFKTYLESPDFANSSEEDKAIAKDLWHKLTTQKAVHLCKTQGPHAPDDQEKSTCKAIFARLPRLKNTGTLLKPLIDLTDLFRNNSGP